MKSPKTTSQLGSLRLSLALSSRKSGRLKLVDDVSVYSQKSHLSFSDLRPVNTDLREDVNMVPPPSGRPLRQPSMSNVKAMRNCLLQMQDTSDTEGLGIGLGVPGDGDSSSEDSRSEQEEVDNLTKDGDASHSDNTTDSTSDSNASSALSFSDLILRGSAIATDRGLTPTLLTKELDPAEEEEDMETSAPMYTSKHLRASLEDSKRKRLELERHFSDKDVPLLLLDEDLEDLETPSSTILQKELGLDINAAPPLPVLVGNSTHAKHMRSAPNLDLEKSISCSRRHNDKSRPERAKRRTSSALEKSSRNKSISQSKHSLNNSSSSALPPRATTYPPRAITAQAIGLAVTSNDDDAKAETEMPPLVDISALPDTPPARSPRQQRTAKSYVRQSSKPESKVPSNDDEPTSKVEQPQQDTPTGPVSPPPRSPRPRTSKSHVRQSSKPESRPSNSRPNKAAANGKTMVPKTKSKDKESSSGHPNGSSKIRRGRSSRRSSKLKKELSGEIKDKEEPVPTQAMTDESNKSNLNTSSTNHNSINNTETRRSSRRIAAGQAVMDESGRSSSNLRKSRKRSQSKRRPSIDGSGHHHHQTDHTTSTTTTKDRPRRQRSADHGTDRSTVRRSSQKPSRRRASSTRRRKRSTSSVRRKTNLSSISNSNSKNPTNLLESSTTHTVESLQLVVDPQAGEARCVTGNFTCVEVGPSLGGNMRLSSSRRLCADSPEPIYGLPEYLKTCPKSPLPTQIEKPQRLQRASSGGTGRTRTRSRSLSKAKKMTPLAMSASQDLHGGVNAVKASSAHVPHPPALLHHESCLF